MTHTDHAPLQLHPNQHIHYIAPDGTPCQGRVLALIPPHAKTRGKQDTYLVERTKDGRHSNVKAEWIRNGEAERCRQEESRCMAEAETDEGALLGARDWDKERAVAEGRG